MFIIHSGLVIKYNHSNCVKVYLLIISFLFQIFSKFLGAQFMEEQKDLLKSLLENRLDRVSILHHLHRFKADYDEQLPYVVLKYQLQLLVIENLSKERGSSVIYSKLKEETMKILRFYHQKRISRKFLCCLVGCIFKTNKHMFYIRHLQRSHSRESSLVCQHGRTCHSTFQTLDLLLQHVRIVHHLPQQGSSHVPKQVNANVQQHQVQAAVPCKCLKSKCLGSEFVSIRMLMLHMRQEHAEEGEIVACIFKNCKKQFDNALSLRSHFYLKHSKIGSLELKSPYKITPVSLENIETDSLVNIEYGLESDSEKGDDEVNSYQYDTASFEIEKDDNAGVKDAPPEDDDQDIFLMSYCDFLNRLSNFHFIPQSTIKIIAEEYIKNYMKANESKDKVLRKALEEIAGISENDIDKVVNDVKVNDNFLEAQNLLNTEYKRKQFLKDKFTYVSPYEIVLNPRAVKEKREAKAVVHYIPIVDTFRNLVQDPSFIEVTENFVQNCDPETFKDVKDGHLYKNNSYFRKNPSAYTMMLYSDAIELVNPLGAGRTKHKVIQIFFSLCEVPKHLRSKIDRIQLVAVFKEKLIKRFGFKKIYQKLVKDLKILEAGVKVFYPVEKEVKCGVLIHPADNLEAHAVGGFSQSFSSNDVCRWCHIQYEDLIENIHDYKDKEHAKWTVEEYDRAAAAAERGIRNDSVEDEIDIGDEEAGGDSENEEDNSDHSSDEESETDSGEDDGSLEMFGIKHCCPLNDLEAFHATTGFPPDMLHDVLEGVASQDLLGIIRILSREGWFSIEQYNMKLKDLKCEYYESSDRPQLVPTNNKVGKLVGKACSIWLHVRNFPLVIRNFSINEDTKALKLALKLHKMIEGVVKNICNLLGEHLLRRISSQNVEL